MINVSNDFKIAAKAPITQVRGYVISQTDLTSLNENNDLKSIIIRQEASLLHTVLRQAEVVHYGTANLLDHTVNLGIGLVLPDNLSVEHIDYGHFKVISREITKGSEEVKLRLYDKMYESLRSWDETIFEGVDFPLTVVELLELICDELGWVLGTTTFTNYDKSIDTDIFTDAVSTYREVLDMIAEVAGGILYFDVDNQLKIRTVDIDKSDPVELVDANQLERLMMEPSWGPVNSVVLSRMPQEDNIVYKDDGSIGEHGLTEIKIENNLIVDANRELWIEDIYTTLGGVEFYPFDALISGLGYLQIGDRITLQDQLGGNYSTVVLGIETKLTGGFNERIYAKVPDKSTTDYNTAGIIGQIIRNTQIIVNKQTGEITLITEGLDGAIAQINLTTEALTASVNQALALGDVNQDNIADLQTALAELELTAEGLELAVTGIGGTNLLKNSVGLKGNVNEWQNYDVDGNLIDSDNDATIDQSADVIANSESGSALVLDEQYIEQTFPTIVGSVYTVYFRYLSDDDATLSITGVSPITLPVQADWFIYKYNFTAGSANTTFRVSNVSAGSGAQIKLTDLVVKLGDVNGWIQAPNEVYGANYRFDKDGFEITSLTSTFKSVLDNEQLAVYDTAGGVEKNTMLVSKDSGIIRNLVAQDQFVVQRYENPTKSIRIIPTSTGGMIVINN
jgi:hypothetical protein